MRSINGWTRLWILAAAVYVIPVASVTARSLPGEKEADRLRELRDGELSAAEAERRRFFSRVTIRADSTALIDNGPHLQPTPIPKSIVRRGLRAPDRRDAIIQEYNRKIVAVSAQHRDRLRTGLLVWLVPVILLYIVGHGAAWVRRGFAE